MACTTTRPTARMLHPINYLLAALVGLAVALGTPLSAVAAPVTMPVQSVSPLAGATTSPNALPTPVQPRAASSGADSVQLADTGGKKKHKRHKKKRHYHIKWSVRVKNHGGQRAVDACRHGLTRWYKKLYGRTYYPIHNYCGGSPILHLHKGNVIKINGKKYRVVSTKKVNKWHSSPVRHMKGSALLQTCYWGSKKYVRVVGVQRL